MTEATIDPGFDWDDIIPTGLMANIIDFGDQDMRLKAASSPSLTTSSARKLIGLGDKELTAAVRANQFVSPRAFESTAAIPTAFAAVPRLFRRGSKVR